MSERALVSAPGPSRRTVTHEAGQWITGVGTPDEATVHGLGESVPRLIRSGLACVVLLFLGFAVWGWLAPLSSAVIGPGQVKVDMNRKTVQHQGGGVVTEILVRDGSRVKAGDPLIVLGDESVGASVDLLRTQLDAELARRARLSAEESGGSEILFSDELLSRASDLRVAELLRRERAIFAARRDGLRMQLVLLQGQVRETKVEVDARRAQLAADESALVHQREELAVNVSLAEQGFVSKIRLSALQRELAALESRRAQNRAEQSRSQQKISELELRAEALRSQFRQEATIGLQQATAQVMDLRERLRPAADAQIRQRIVAPIDGEIVGLRITSVGAVLAPREHVLDIVPDDADLVVEARLRPQDVSHVQSGSEADVRLTGLRQRLTPTVQGRVLYVSADRLVDAGTHAPYYLAQVHVPAEQIARLGDARLQPGMPAEVYIRTVSRTALEYLLDPFLGFLNRSMREQ
jgi:membrane fusion protein, epimerase transport system